MKDEVLMKLSEEEGRYIDWLLSQPPEVILANAKRYVHREAIIDDIKLADLSESEMLYMLESPHLLEDLEESYRV